MKVSNPKVERSFIHEDFRQDLLQLLDQLRKQRFEGICFILDGSEFLVKQDWANDAWSYLRALKDTGIALKPRLGFILSGYRDLKDYQQRVGSPLLNIADIEWLSPLTETETRSLISHRSQTERISLTTPEIKDIIEWAGGHPYLTQQMLNIMFDDRRLGKVRSPNSLSQYLIRQHDRDFAGW